MPFGTDMLEEAYPLRNFAVDEVRAGRPFPAWNPFAYSGIPFLETLPYPVFYPTSLLYFVIPLGRAIGWAFVLHFLAAGVFMLAFVRRLGLSRWAAAVSGLAFMFNGYLVSHLYAGQDGRMFAMTLIPLVFLFLRAGLDSGRVGPYLLMGGAVALQIFTPHVQVMYFSSLAAVAYFAVEAVAIGRREGLRRALLHGGLFALGFLLAALVAAVQLWPTAAFLKWAVRGAESGYAYASSWAMPPGEVSALLVPDLFGSLSTYWGSNPFKLHTEYVGAVPLVLAVAAILWGERRRTLFWALLALAAVLFAMGAATPVHRLAYAVVPMIDRFRAPSMMMAVAAFALATLAGLGLDSVLARRGAAGAASRDWRRVAFLATAGLLLVAWGLSAAAPEALAGLFGGSSASEVDATRAAARAAALRALPASLGVSVLAWLAAVAVLVWGVAGGRLRAAAASTVLATLLVADLWRVDARYLKVVDVGQAFAADPADRFLMAQEGPFRVLPLTGAMGPNEPVLHRLEAVWGLQKFRLAWYDELLGGATGRNLGRPALWRVLNLRYLVSEQPLAPEEGFERVFEGPPQVYRWGGEAPRAWVAADARIVDDEEALRLLSDPAFDVRGVALLAAPFPGAAARARPVGSEASASGGPGAGDGRSKAGAEGRRPRAAVGGVRYLGYAPNTLEAEVVASAPGYAVFSEPYHPYWQATVDGRPTPVARADLAFRAVPVPAGTHRVRLEYRPRAFERARLVSLGALAAGLGYAAASAWNVRRRRRVREGDGA